MIGQQLATILASDWCRLVTPAPGCGGRGCGWGRWGATRWAAWGPHEGAGETILGHSWAGALHLWQQGAGGWGPGVVGGGHQDTVADLSWDTEGRYLVSVS